MIKKKTLYACNDSLVLVENTNDFLKGCLILQLCNNSKKKYIYKILLTSTKKILIEEAFK